MSSSSTSLSLSHISVGPPWTPPFEKSNYYISLSTFCFNLHASNLIFTIYTQKKKKKKKKFNIWIDKILREWIEISPYFFLPFFSIIRGHLVVFSIIHCTKWPKKKITKTQNEKKKEKKLVDPKRLKPREEEEKWKRKMWKQLINLKSIRGLIVLFLSSIL